MYHFEDNIKFTKKRNDPSTCAFYRCLIIWCHSTDTHVNVACSEDTEKPHLIAVIIFCVIYKHMMYTDLSIGLSTPNRTKQVLLIYGKFRKHGDLT